MLSVEYWSLIGGLLNVNRLLSVDRLLNILNWSLLDIFSLLDGIAGSSVEFDVGRANLGGGDVIGCWLNSANIVGVGVISRFDSGGIVSLILNWILIVRSLVVSGIIRGEIDIVEGGSNILIDWNLIVRIGISKIDDKNTCY
jgi:hypothetical protein